MSTQDWDTFNSPDFRESLLWDARKPLLQVVDQRLVTQSGLRHTNKEWDNQASRMICWVPGPKMEPHKPPHGLLYVHLPLPLIAQVFTLLMGTTANPRGSAIAHGQPGRVWWTRTERTDQTDMISQTGFRADAHDILFPPNELLEATLQWHLRSFLKASCWDSTTGQTNAPMDNVNLLPLDVPTGMIVKVCFQVERGAQKHLVNTIVFSRACPSLPLGPTWAGQSKIRRGWRFDI